MFKFTIRDLVLLTLVAALSVGWWVERWRLAGVLEKLAVHEAAEERRAKRIQDEKRLKSLELALHASRATSEYGAPVPVNGPAKLTALQKLKMAEEIGELSDRLSAKKSSRNSNT